MLLVPGPHFGQQNPASLEKTQNFLPSFHCQETLSRYLQRGGDITSDKRITKALRKSFLDLKEDILIMEDLRGFCSDEFHPIANWITFLADGTQPTRKKF